MQLLRAMARLGVLALAGLAPGCGGNAASAAGSDNQNPITRVVELLKDLESRIEKEGKEEEDLYETFVCWAKSIISQKTETNEAGQSRVDVLQQYIDDLDAGKIELTTERVDLTKEIKEISGDMEVVRANREQEQQDFELAQDDLEKAIDALGDAITVLKTATGKHTSGVLLEASLGSSAESRAQEAAALSNAVEIGKRVLTPGDAFFLQRLLTGEVPKADWKTLNRKATFKMDYKARSFKIQGVLAKMSKMFQSNLADAIAKEEAAIGLYDEIMGAKGKEKDSAEAALKSMEKESGARGQSREEAVEERDSLTDQIKNDKNYIEQVEESLKEKKAEWDDRKALRTGESAAVSKAISILRADDARDLFKKSLASQGGLFFLQEGVSTSSSQRLASNAAETLRAAAEQAHDSRLSVLALRLGAASGSHFTEVVKAIDDMIKDLGVEEKDDLRKKDECEANRAKDTREAIKIARAMDELSDSIMSDEANIEDIIAEIANKNEEIKSIGVELKEAKDLREKEEKEFTVAKRDDEDAAEVVKSAKKILEDFYAENGLMLLQQRKRGQAPFESEAGKAPPPPPSTWQAPYFGKTDESTSVIAMLDTIYDDIQKDIAKAKGEEEEAVEMYGKTKLAMENEMKDLQGAIDDLEEAKGDRVKAVEDNGGGRRTQRGRLDVVLRRIAEAEPGCDFLVINYPLRLQNRQVEIDGLKKAKAILSGGRFSLIAAADAGSGLNRGEAATVQQGRLRANRKQTHMALE